MKNFYYIFICFVILQSCQNEYKITSITIGEQKHVVGEHYNSDMTICFKDEVGSSHFNSILYVETKDNREFECYQQVFINAASSVKSSDKCVTFRTRPFFNKRGSSDDDMINMKSMRRGNIKKVKVVVHGKSYDGHVSEKTFM